jgi:hypothetical protein
LFVLWSLVLNPVSIVHQTGITSIMLSQLWRVATLPKAFFAQLNDDEVSLAKAFWSGFVCYVPASLLFALALLLLTRSQGVSLFLLTSLFVSSLQYLFFWGLGGLILQQPHGLDIRAWELSGWSWSPALFVALSLVPAGLLVLISPLPRDMLALLMAVGACAAVIWHVRTVNVGLIYFVNRRQPQRLMWYVGLLFLLPLAPFGWLLWQFR